MYVSVCLWVQLFVCLYIFMNKKKKKKFTKTNPIFFQTEGRPPGAPMLVLPLYPVQFTIYIRVNGKQIGGWVAM